MEEMEEVVAVNRAGAGRGVTLSPVLVGSARGLQWAMKVALTLPVE